MFRDTGRHAVWFETQVGVGRQHGLFQTDVSSFLFKSVFSMALERQRRFDVNVLSTSFQVASERHCATSRPTLHRLGTVRRDSSGRWFAMNVLSTPDLKTLCSVACRIEPLQSYLSQFRQTELGCNFDLRSPILWFKTGVFVLETSNPEENSSRALRHLVFLWCM